MWRTSAHAEQGCRSCRKGRPRSRRPTPPLPPPVDLLPLIERGEEDVASRSRLSRMNRLIAVGREADALARGRVADLDLLEPDRPCCGQAPPAAPDFVTSSRGSCARHRKSVAGAERKAWKIRRQGGSGSAWRKRSAAKKSRERMSAMKMRVADPSDQGASTPVPGHGAEGRSDIHGEENSNPLNATCTPRAAATQQDTSPDAIKEP